MFENCLLQNVHHNLWEIWSKYPYHIGQSPPARKGMSCGIPGWVYHIGQSPPARKGMDCGMPKWVRKVGHASTKSNFQTHSSRRTQEE